MQLLAICAFFRGCLYLPFSAAYMHIYCVERSRVRFIGLVGISHRHLRPPEEKLSVRKPSTASEPSQKRAKRVRSIVAQLMVTLYVHIH